MPSLLEDDQGGAAPDTGGGLFGLPANFDVGDALGHLYSRVKSSLAPEASPLWPLDSPVGTERVGDQSVGMPDPNVSPVIGLLGDRPVTAAAHQRALDLASTMAQFGPADVGAISLAQIHPRTLRPLSSAVDLGKPGSHAYSIMNHDGEPVGIVDTSWTPDTGNLHIEDIQSNEGANSLGPGAIRQVRDLLVARYPNVKTLSGQRITGAISADRMSGSGPGRAATQTVTTSSKDQ